MSRFILNLLAIASGNRNSSLPSTVRVTSRIEIAVENMAHTLGADLQDSPFDDEDYDEE